MSAKTTWITFVVAVIAVLAAVFTSGMERDARPERGGILLLTADDLPIDSVERITLTRRGEQRLVFERGSAGAWSQVEPFTHHMNAYFMRQLASAARDVRIVDQLAPGDLRGGLTAATLGLDPPEAAITYDFGHRTLAIALGRKGIAGRAYMRVGDDDRILIASQELHELAVEMNPKEWRDRALFRNVGVECDRIVRDLGGFPEGAPEGRLVIERDRRTWRMLEPVRTRVDQTALERYMQSLGGARAGGFIADNPSNLARFGLLPTGGSASLAVMCTRTQADGEEITRTPHVQKLLVGIPAGAGTQDRFAMIEGRPAVVRLPAAAIQALFGPVERLIDPTGSGVLGADVKAVRIIAGESDLRLERELERWFGVASGGRREIDAQLAHELLAKVTEFRAPEVSIQEYPRELEVAVITLIGFDGRPLDTVRVLRDPDSGKWALENGDNVLRIFPPEFQIGLLPRDYGL